MRCIDGCRHKVWRWCVSFASVLRVIMYLMPSWLPMVFIAFSTLGRNHSKVSFSVASVFAELNHCFNVEVLPAACKVQEILRDLALGALLEVQLLLCTRYHAHLSLPSPTQWWQGQFVNLLRWRFDNIKSKSCFVDLTVKLCNMHCCTFQYDVELILSCLCNHSPTDWKAAS